MQPRLMVCCAAVVAWAGASTYAGGRNGETGPVAMPGQLLLRVTPALARDIRSGAATSGMRRALPLSRLRGDLKAKFRRWKIQPAVPAIGFDPKHAEIAARYGLDRLYVIDVPAVAANEVMAALTFPTQGIEAVAVSAYGTVAGTLPNDPLFQVQYGLHNTGQLTGSCSDADIDAPEAWQLHTGNGTVTIGVVDSGVSPHEDLNARLLPGRNVVGGADPNDTTDGCGAGHGTHVAGIAAAAGNNNLGGTGVIWNADILPVKVLSGCGGFAADMAEGIIWATDNGADVINVSLQFYNLSGLNLSIVQGALNYAHDLDVVIVAAAGNNNLGGFGVVAAPASMDNALGVSATTFCDEFATPATAVSPWSSNHGPEVDLSAPGDEIYSTLIGNNYGVLFGTSMATPFVSGSAALLRSANPGLSNTNIEGILLSSTDDLGPAGWDEQFGTGRLNIGRALRAALSPCTVDGDCVDSVPCTTGTCVAGVCIVSTDDALCDDGVLCNGAEKCDAIVGCQSGGPPDCDDGVGCTVDECDVATDVCLHSPNDLACSDGFGCNGTERCDPDAGCQPGVPFNCDDGLECTLDGCLENPLRCGHTPRDEVCDDAVFCNGAEWCDIDSGCMQGPEPDCTDAVICTVDTCDPQLDACGHTPDDGACDDGIFCNGGETCDIEFDCLVGAAPDCNDGIACTIDSCDPFLNACRNDPADEFCDDGVFCNGRETCSAEGGCRPGSSPCPTELTCNEDLDECEIPPIPTVSAWGFAVLLLLLITAAKLRPRSRTVPRP